jgi:hypothetical protein
LTTEASTQQAGHRWCASEICSWGRADGQIELVDGDGEVDLAVNAIAAPAMSFMAEIGAFYVRELPGRVTDKEKVAR